MATVLQYFVTDITFLEYNRMPLKHNETNEERPRQVE